MSSDFWGINYGVPVDQYDWYDHDYDIYEPPLRDFSVSDMGEILLVATDFMLNLETSDMGEIILLSEITFKNFTVSEVNNGIYTVTETPSLKSLNIEDIGEVYSIVSIPNREFKVSGGN